MGSQRVTLPPRTTAAAAAAAAAAAGTGARIKNRDKVGRPVPAGWQECRDYVRVTGRPTAGDLVRPPTYTSLTLVSVTCR